MTLLNSINFKDVVLMISDMDPTTPTFVAPCGFTTLTIQRQANTNTDEIPDCDDPTKPNVSRTSVQSLNQSFSASGVVRKTDTAVDDQWDLNEWLAASGKIKDIRIMEYEDRSSNPTPTVIGYYEVEALITNVQLSGSDGTQWRIQVDAVINDQLDDTNWTSGAPV